MTLPHVPRRPVTAPSPDVLFPFIDFLADYDPELLAAVELLNSGARRVDLAVKWPEWNPEKAEIILGVRGLVLARLADGEPLPPSRGGRPPKRVAMVRDTPTSKRRYRTIALDEAANAALKNHWRACSEISLAAGAGAPDGYIFSEDLLGQVPRRPDWASHAFLDARQAAAKAGLRGLEIGQTGGVEQSPHRRDQILVLVGRALLAGVAGERLAGRTGPDEIEAADPLGRERLHVDLDERERVVRLVLDVDTDHAETRPMEAHGRTAAAAAEVDCEGPGACPGCDIIGVLGRVSHCLSFPARNDPDSHRYALAGR